LTLCFLDADCPVIPDSIDGQQVIAAAIGGPDPLAQKLSVDLANALAFPSRTGIDECHRAPGDEKAFEACVSRRMPSPALAPLLTCVAIQNDKERALCLTKNSPKEVASFIECVVGKGGAATASVPECSKLQPWDKVRAVRSCVEEVTARKVDRLVTGLEPKQQALATCLADSNNRSDAALICLSKFDPASAAKIDEVTCAAKAGTDSAALVGCFSKTLKGDAAKLAPCAVPDQAKLASCILGTRPEYKAASEVVACVRGGRDAASLVANCSGILIKDEKTRVALACVTRAGSDTQQLAGCATNSIFPPAIARYASCAATSQGGATTFALCAAGPVMNEEWRIAAECAVHTGGNPVGFAGCTAGRLTLKELTGCFTGKSCFGPNNTIAHAFNTTFNDLLHGPGKNSEIVVALAILEKLSGGPNSVINNPDQLLGGKNSLFHNPGQILGGEKSVANQILTKPFGGSESVPNVVTRGAERMVQGAAKGVEHVGQEAGKAGAGY